MSGPVLREYQWEALALAVNPMIRVRFGFPDVVCLMSHRIAATNFMGGKGLEPLTFSV